MKTIYVLLFTVISFASLAQSEGVAFGIKGGLNLSNLKVNDQFRYGDE